MDEPDSGLATERTRLAWRRTTLAATVAVLISATHIVLSDATSWELAALALTALVWLALIILAYRRIAVLTGATPPVRRLPAAVALLVVAIAILGVLVNAPI